MDKTLWFRTLLNGQIVVASLEHRNSRLRVSNPSSPELRVADSLTSHTIFHRFTVPYNATLFGPDRASDLPYDEVLRRFVEHLQDHGTPNGFTFTESNWKDRQPPTIPDALDAVRAFFNDAARLIGSQSFQANGIAAAVRHPLETVNDALAQLTNDGLITHSNGLYELVNGPIPPYWNPRTDGHTELGIKGRFLRIMIGGPGDTEAERRVAQDIIARWNSLHAEENNVALIYKHWTSHVVPLMGERPQAQVNEQLVDKADVLVALFWNRLGMPTGAEISGTVEEIRRMMTHGKPTLVYFNAKPVPQALMGDAKAMEEFQRLRSFQQEIEEQRRGFYTVVRSTRAFRDDFEQKLTRLVRDLVERDFVVASAGGAGAIVNRRQLLTDVGTARKALETLYSKWRTSTAVHGSLQEPQRLLTQLSTLITEHRAHWKESLSGQAADALQYLATGAHVVAKQPITFGSHQWIIESGTGCFERAEFLLGDLKKALE